MSAMPKTGNEQKTVKPVVRRLLTKYGWFWWGHSAGVFGKSGISDTLALHTGVFLAIESKFGRRRATAQQIGYLNSITAENGFGLVVNDKLLDQLEIFLDHFNRSTQTISEQKRIGADVGAPMLDALKALTAYPKTMEDYVASRHGLADEVDLFDEDDVDLPAGQLGHPVKRSG
jgi:hypothetical protein